MTDLAPAERIRLMNAVFATEAVLRDLIQPHKVNLASLGNAVPHLHWHVVPRHNDDRHFPKPIWAEPSRARSSRRAAPDRGRLAAALKTRLP
jgi:diadenosine tetraphosphate (Ap4A) HIT family hydrolase